MNKPLFHGRASMLGGGSSSAKANTAATPVQGKDNLRSKSTARLIDIISEGPILGLVNGLQSVIVNDIPVQEPNGLFNYSNARMQFRTGEKVQAPLDGFSDVENQFQVNLTPKSKSNTVGRVGIISGGSGYTYANVAFIGQLGTPGVVGGTGPNASLPLVETKPATGHAVISNGSIVQIVIDDPGSNYVGHPEVRVTGDGGGFSGYPVMGGGAVYAVKDNNVDAVRITGLLRNFYAGDDKGNVGDISVVIRLEYRDDINQDWRPAFDDSKFIPFAGGTSPLTNAFRGDAQFLIKPGESYNIQFVARNVSTNGATFVYDTVSGYNDTGADMMVNATGLALDLPLGQYDHSVGDTFGHTLLGYTPYYYDYNNANITITGKTTSGYEEAWLVRLPLNRGKRDVRMWRVIEDSVNQYWFNDITFEYATEVISSRIMYADSALCAFEADAEFFGGSVPKRAYDVYGRIIRVPSNYDPAARTYNGLWDGTFKYAYSNNPVWVFLDLLTHPRYGLGQWVKDRHIDTGALYVMSRYCDELVDNKRGGRSPRFTLNTQIMNQEEAYSVLNMLASVFRGMIYWSTGTIFATQDSPGPVKRIVSPSKVINGDFSYVGVGKDAQHSVARVAWNDPTNNYERAFAYYEDPSRIDRYGYEIIDLVAYGCTDEAMALRMGKWLIDSEKYANKVVTFRGGWDFADAVPGEIIGVADPTRAGVRQGGRVKSATTANLTFDAPYTFQAGQTYVLTVAVPTWGRCLLNPGSATVAGNRTLFNNGYNGLAAGDEIIFDKDPKRYSIKSVDSATQITLTTPYIGGKTGKAHYTVLRNSTFVMSSYVDLLDVPINHPGAGSFSTVSFQRAMPVIVNPESEWIIAASNVVPAQFRIQAVKEVSRGQFEVVALEHDPNKYLRVEQDVPILPPTTYLPPDVKAVTPRNPSAAESRYLRYGVVRNKISLFWEDGSPLNPSSGYYVFADTPNNGTVNYGFTNTQNIDIEDTVAGEYVFYITALSIGGDTSQPLVFSFQASAWDGIVGATVTNLSVVNGYGPDNTYFQTNSPTWAWDITFPAGTPNYDVKFNLYLYDADAGTVIRFIPNVTDQKYTYLYDANYADNGGRPKRKLRLKVVALDVLGREGSSATKVAYNPPPDVPTFDLGGISNFISVFISAPTDPDFKGYYVWVSKTQAFDPYSTPVTYTGVNNTLYFPADTGATYYVRVAAFDAFSSNINDLLISPEKSVRASLEIVSFAAPSIPQNLVLTTSSYVGDDGETYARLVATWDAVNSDNIGFYDVFIAEGATSDTTQFVGGNYVNTNKYTLNGLPAGLTVSVFVKSISKNRLGVSDPSAIKNIKLALNTTPPGPVTGLKVDVSPQTSAISWTNPANKDLAGVTILRGTTNNYGSATVIGRTSAPGNTYIDTTVSTGTTYYYWAMTVNRSGVNGSVVGPVSAVPPQIQSAALAAGVIDATKLATSISPVTVVTTLPTTKTTQFVTLQSDGKLYRWDSTANNGAGAYTSTVDIGQLDAAKINGQLTDAQIAGIAAAKIAGQLTDDQLAAIAATKLTGSIVASQITSLTAAQITGQLTDTQIAGLSATKVTGKITKTQITDSAIDTPQLNAGAVTTAKVSAGAITAGKLSVSSTNYVFNSEFTQVKPDNARVPLGIVFSNNGTATPSYYDIRKDYCPSGFTAFALTFPTTATSGLCDIYFNRVGTDGSMTNKFPVTAGIAYEFSAYLSVLYGGTGTIYIEFFNAAGASLGATVANTVNVILNGQSPAAWEAAGGRAKVLIRAPANAVSAGLNARWTAPSTAPSTSPYLFVSGPMFAAISDTQLASGEASPYEPSGVTTITGSSVLTGSLSADRIVTRSITALQIAATTITADQIAGKTITAAQIATRTITATQILGETITAKEIAAGGVTASRLTIGSGNIVFNAAGNLTDKDGNLLGATAYDSSNTNGGAYLLSLRTDNNYPATNPFCLRPRTVPPTKGSFSYFALQALDATTGNPTKGMAITPGAVYEASCYMAAFDGTGVMFVDGYNSSTGASARLITVNLDPAVGSALTRIGGLFTVPTNIDRCVFNAGVYWTGGGNPHLFTSALMIGATAPGQTELSPWVNSGVTQIDGSNLRTGSITANQLNVGDIFANTAVISKITAGVLTVGAVKAGQIAAGAVTADKIGVGLGVGNLIWNSDRAVDGWVKPYMNTAGSYVQYRADWGASGYRSVCIYTPGTPAANNFDFIDLQFPQSDNSADTKIPIFGGQQYEFSAYLSMHRCVGYIELIWLNSAGTEITRAVSSQITSNGRSGVADDSWRARGMGTAPSDALYAIFRLVRRTDGGNEPYLFASCLYLAQTAPGATVYSAYAPQSRTTITGGQIATASLNADRIVSGSITTTQLSAGNIDAKVINATTFSAAVTNTGLLNADSIVVGTGSLSNLITGANTTKINGGAIQANSINVGSLKVAQRNIQLVGISFYSERDASGNQTNIVRWTDGYVLAQDSNGSAVSYNIAFSGRQIDTGFWYIWWNINAPTYFNCEKDNWPAIYADPACILLATVSNVTGLSVLVGGTVIDGTRIMTRSIQAEIIASDAIQTRHMKVGTIDGDRITAASLAADKITTGTITVNAVLNIGTPQSQLWSDGNGGGLRVYNRNRDAWRVAVGYLGIWTGDGNDFGMIVWGNDNNVKLRISNGQNYLDGAIIGDATIGTAAIGKAVITNAKIGDLEVDTIKITNGAISQVAAGSGQDYASTSLAVRTEGGRVLIQATMKNDPNVSRTNRVPGSMYIQWDRDGADAARATLDETPKNFWLQPGVAYYWGTTTSAIVVQLPKGVHDFHCTTNAGGNLGTIIAVTELAK